ncbi:uncharacterized protein V1516DRAFT_673117 [Lipomyces oligophaga]|uniref:uncharacterized protein n=1 Tax=Lipomyces oligophaga TaxID=45792 RepID=UPI0034CF3C19
MVAVYRLGTLKKKDLADMASNLGIDSSGIKIDLENRISDFLLDNHSTYKSDPSYGQFYLRNTTPKATSTAISSSQPGDSKQGLIFPATPIQRVGTDRSSTASQTPSPEAQPTTPSTFSLYADQVSSASSAAKRQFTDYTVSSASTIISSSRRARSNLSSVVVVNMLELSLEAIFFAIYYFPLTYEVNLISFPFTGYSISITTVTLPNLASLLKYDAFWRPTFFWATYLVILPWIVSYYVNFTSLKAHGSKARQVVDPVTFNVVKLLLAYLLLIRHTEGSAAFFPFIDGGAEIVKIALGSIPFIGGSICLLAGLYVGMLF